MKAIITVAILWVMGYGLISVAQREADLACQEKGICIDYCVQDPTLIGCGDINYE